MAFLRRSLSTIGGASALLLLLGADGGGCGGGAAPAPVSTGTTIRHELGATNDFYAAPFPNEMRRRADGSVDMSGFPNPNGIALVDQLLGILNADSNGFGMTSAVYFSTTAPLDPSTLPDMRKSTQPDAPVFLMSVDPDAPDFGARYPIQVGFQADGGPSAR